MSPTLISIIACILAAPLISLFLKYSTKSLEPPAPEGIGSEEWDVIYKIGKSDYWYKASASTWLGIFERLIFLAALDHPEVIVGWLAFKVAAKWEVWRNVVQVPTSLGMNDTSFLKTRMTWGSWILMRFLIGTSLNILVVLLAFYLGNTLGAEQGN
jgi:hypothetical protein